MGAAIKDMGDVLKVHGTKKLQEVIEKNQKPFIPRDKTDPEPEQRLPPIVNAGAFLGCLLNKPPQLIRGLLHQGSKMALAGGSKSFKTWSLLDLAMSVATGNTWWGFQTTKTRVLYVNLELVEFAIHSRMVDIQSARTEFENLENLDVWNLRGYAVSFEQLRPQIVETIKKGYSLIVLDPIYKVYGDRDENSAGDMSTLLNEFERLAVESGAAVIFGAHFSKGNQAGKESIDRISGSGVFARDPDTLLVMTKHERQDAFTVDVTLRNFKPIEPFCVEHCHPLMVRNDSLDPKKLKQAGNKTKYTTDQLLMVLGGQSLSTTDWEKQTTTDIGMSSRTFLEKLKLLREDGTKVSKNAAGLWSVTETKKGEGAEVQ